MIFALRIVLLSAVLLLGVIFLVLRLNNNIEWDWGLIFIPEWVVLGAWLGMDVVAFVRDLRKRETPKDYSYLADILSGLATIFLVLFLVFIVIKLEVHPDWPWAAVYSALWAALLVCVFPLFVLANRIGIVATLYACLIWTLLVTASILIDIRLDVEAASDWTWQVVFIPLWILYGFWMIWLSILIWRKVKVDPSLARYKPLWINIYVYAWLWAGFLTFTILLNINAEIPGSIGILFVFTPLIIMFAALFVIPYFVFATRRRYSNKKRMVPWLYDLTPIFLDLGPPLNPKTGKPLWSTDPQDVLAEAPLPSPSSTPTSPQTPVQTDSSIRIFKSN